MMEQPLADLAVLYQKLRNYHWNVVGKQFMQLHKLLEEEYDKIAEELDEVAELVRMKGQKPLSTYKEFLEHTTIKEGDKAKKADEMIKDIAADYEKLLKDFKTQLNGDPTTDDVFTGIARHFEKSLWMLKALQA